MDRFPALRRLLATVVALLPLIAVAALPAAGLDREQFERTRNAWVNNREALDVTTDTLESVDAQAQDAATQLLEVTQRLDGAKSDLARLQRRLRKAKSRERAADGANDTAIQRLGQETRSLASMEESLAVYVEELEVQIVAAYKYGGTSAQFRGIIDMLLSSGTLSEFTAAYEKLQASTIDKGNIVEGVTTLAADLAEQRVVVEVLQRKTERAERAAVGRRERVAKITTRQARLVQRTRDDRRTRRRLLVQLEAERVEYEERAAQLEAQSAALFEQLREYQYMGGAPGSKDLLWPTDGHVTSGFGHRRHPVLKKRRLHAGIDIPAPTGQEIYAVASGTVITAGRLGGYGNVVVIDHGDGITTVYAHQSTLLVRAGDEVRAGDAVGEVGSTGLSTGPHLHFEVRLGGQAVNPLDWY